jgi:hypothetical protein
MTEDVLSWRKIDECALFCNLITPQGDSWADLGLGTYLFMRLVHVRLGSHGDSINFDGEILTSEIPCPHSQNNNPRLTD